MTKTIEFDGIKHEFPDDFSDAEIKSALMSHEPQQQAPPAAAGPRPTSTGADKGYVGNALKPITNYPATFANMRHELQDQMSHGVQQMLHPDSAMDVVKGAGNLGLGFVGNALAPVNAAIDTVVGQPIEENTGIPRDLPDFAVQMALPMPKGVPRGTGSVAKVGEKVAPTVEELYASAKKGFEHPDVAGLSLKPKAVRDWSDALRNTMTEDGFDENVAPKTWAILRSLDKAPANSVVTGKNLKSLRQTFSAAAGTAEPSEKAAASHAIEALDSFIGKGVPKDAILGGDPSLVASIWSNARGDYAAAKRSERIDQAVEKATNNAGAANSGQNIDNATRQQLKSILNNPKQRRGFSGEELRQMQRIVRGTFTGDAVRFAANLLGGGGGLGMMTAASVGAYQGGQHAGPLGAAVGVLTPIVGFALKKLSNAITGGGVEQLGEMVRSRSPLGEQMRAPVQKWGEAVTKYNSSKTPQNVARLMLASKNLANNLQSAGIATTAEKLISGLQGPVDDSASEKQ